jgi:pimeloyl-ACP methyl ester carboxylesterase
LQDLDVLRILRGIMNVNGISAELHGELKGNSVVFIHGFLLTKRLWGTVIPNLDSDLGAVTYDMRGAGESEIGSGQYTLESYVDDLVAVMDKLKIKQTVLCGHELGAHVAFRAAEREPKRIRGVLACNAAPEPVDREETLTRSEWVRRIQGGAYRRFVRNYFPTLFAESSKTQDGTPYPELRAEAERQDPTGVVGQILAALTRPNPRPFLEESELPVVAMTGELDDDPDHDHLLRLALSLAGLNVLRVPDSGHTLPAEHPRYVADAVSHFVTRVMET